MSDTERLTLQRLLSQGALEELLAAYQAARTQGALAVLRADGQVYARAGEMNENVRRDLAAPHAFQNAFEPFDTGEARMYPLRAGTVYVGALVVAPPDDALVAPLVQTLTQWLQQALETRRVAAEALDRYREINLLYRVHQTFGAALDPEALAQRALQESMHVIPADAGLLCLREATGAWQLHGHETVPPVAAPALVQLLESILTQGNAVILGGLEAPLLRDAPVWRNVLAVPLVGQADILGVLVLARADAQNEFRAGQEKLLSALAGAAAIHLENARLHRAALVQQRLESELQVAHQVQASLLPRAVPQIEGWEFAAWWQPAREMSGDYYDFIVSPNSLGLVIADVTDKGIPSAMFMANTRSVMRATMTLGNAPAAGVTHANRLLCADSVDSMFVTVFYAQLNPITRELVYVNGGHNPPLWYRTGESESLRLTRTGIMLGYDETFVFDEQRIVMDAGDVLVLYTDGVTDAVNAEKKRFGEAHLRQVLEQHRHAPAETILRAVREALDAFIGETAQYDDITLVIAKCAPARFQMTRAARIEYLPEWRAFLAGACARVQADKKVAHAFQVAVDEVCTNLIAYNAAQPATFIELTFEAQRAQFVLTVRDDGASFDPHDAPVPDVSSALELRRVGGLGWYFVNAYMDAVQYRADAVHGNVLTLIKHVGQ